MEMVSSWLKGENINLQNGLDLIDKSIHKPGNPFILENNIEYFISFTEVNQ